MEGTNQEGPIPEGRSSQARRGLTGNSNGGKQGMADTIAEITKKYYFSLNSQVTTGHTHGGKMTPLLLFPFFQVFILSTN